MSAEYSISKSKLCENYFTSLFALQSFTCLLDESTHQVDGKQVARILSHICMNLEMISDPLRHTLWPGLSEQGCGAREKAQA